ncbi:MAG: chaperonin GroEL [Pseudomonadota bacterium]
MVAKTLVKRDESLQGIIQGMETSSRAVGVTFGPSGRSVFMEREYGGRISRDGVSISRVIELEERLPNIGAQLIKQVGVEMSDVAGDGTSLAIILTASMAKEATKAVAAGLPANEIRMGITKAAAVVDQVLMGASVSATQNHLRRVAETAARGDTELAALVVKALDGLDTDAFISVEAGDGFETDVQRSTGIFIEEGFVSSDFADHLMQAQRTLEDPLILVTDHALSNLEPLIPLLDATYEAGRALFVIAADIKDEALTTLLTNDRSGVLPSVAIRAPGREHRRIEKLTDIAIATGAEFISVDQSMRLEDVTIDDLGTAGVVIVNSKRTHIRGGDADPDALKTRREHVRGQRNAATSEFEREELSRRLSSLQGESVKITVGGLSTDEIKERRDLAANCVQSTKAAKSSGVLPGSGLAFLHAKPALAEAEPKSAGERAGFQLVARALMEPAKLVVSNQGGDGSYFVAQYQDDISQIESFGENQAWDPTSTLRLAFSVSSSLAATTVGIDGVIHEN